MSDTEQQKNSLIRNTLQYLSVIGLVLFICGFWIWNIYLSALGFSEDEIVKTRFILTGFIFALITGVGSFLLFQVAYSISWVLRKILPITFRIKNYRAGSKSIATLLLLFLFFWPVYFSIHIFPKIPFVFGGGQPRALDFLISNIDDQNMLNSIGININEKAKATHQTIHVCVAYENRERAVINLYDRIVSINKSVYQGLISLPSASSTSYDQLCTDQALCWASVGFYSKFDLLEFIPIDQVDGQPVSCDQSLQNQPSQKLIYKCSYKFSFKKLFNKITEVW